jgi:hypothetical protein
MVSPVQCVQHIQKCIIYKPFWYTTTCWSLLMFMDLLFLYRILHQRSNNLQVCELLFIFFITFIHIQLCEFFCQLHPYTYLSIHERFTLHCDIGSNDLCNTYYYYKSSLVTYQNRRSKRQDSSLNLQKHNIFS